MATCVVCGEQDFNCVDGLYFCNSCSTQSQDVRQEENDVELALASAQPQNIIRPAKGPKKAAKSTQEKCKNLGRPWATSELIQLILREQVKAIAKLGASPDHAAVAFKLWCMYLGKLGYAFANDPEEKRLYHRFRQRERDNFKPSLDCPLVIPSRGRRSRTVLKAPATREETASGSERAARDIMTRGNSKQKDEEEGDANSSEDPDEDELPFSQQEDIGSTQARCLSTERPEVLGLKTALSICYLSLLYTNNLTTVADLIRWTHQGKIPYLNADKLLPDDIQFSYDDHTIFSAAKLPDSRSIRNDAHGVACLLDLKCLPPVDLAKLCSKYIMRLCLPGDMHRLVHKLITVKPPTLQYVPSHTGFMMPDFDAIAMSYIVVTLKLLFGLDDKIEVALSAYARDLNAAKSESDAADSGRQFFVWEDWMIHMHRKEQHFVRTTQLPDTFVAIASLQDVDSCLKTFEHMRAPPRRHSRFTEEHKLWQAETREKLSRPFANLNAVLSEARGRTRCATQDKAIHTESNFDALAGLFVSDSLAHIADDYSTEARTFELHDESGNYDLRGQACQTPNCNNPADSPPEGHMHSLRDRYALVLEARKNYVIYPPVPPQPKTAAGAALRGSVQMQWLPPSWHRSYHWLLSMCSSIIYSDCFALHKEVRNLEIILLDSHGCTTVAKCLRTKLLKRRFQRKPFPD